MLNPLNTCVYPLIFYLTALSYLWIKTPVDIYIHPDVAPRQCYISCDGNSCPRWKKTVFILQEQSRMGWGWYVWTKQLPAVPLPCLLVLSAPGLEAQSSCWSGNILWCQHFLYESPWVRTRHWKDWSVGSLTALFKDFLNSDHKEGCVPKQVWHHKWVGICSCYLCHQSIGQVRYFQKS